VHAVRGNFDITFLCHNNENYGLTKGQASATTREDVAMNSNPDGVTSTPIHPQRLALSLGATFSARIFSGDIAGMNRVFQAAIAHKGFAFVEILQNCPTYNKHTPHEWYQQRVYNINETDHDTSNRAAAVAAAEDINEKVATGILYQDPNSVPFMMRDAVRKDLGAELIDEVKTYDITPYTSRMR
ncbi:2-oxoacid ferredoxin oxidoreductase, partial [Candidatus Woesebacteria bacterium]|nr:2-oxoacid ferredoxin oxidoreductase [Candidatus Woesebacteria bacterium]